VFKTNRLVIIGGPSSVGKSTLMEKMRDGIVPHLCEHLSIELPSSYLHLNAGKLHNVGLTSIDRLVFHYDILGQYSPRDGFNYLPDMILRAHSVVILTLCVSQNTLINRTTSRLSKNFKSFLWRPEIRRAKNLHKRWMKRKLYRNASKIITLYDEWSEFVESSGVTEHFILNQDTSGCMTVKQYDRNIVHKLLELDIKD